ncbi:unnamed protein product, partial [Didymodactylos carnosus]
IVRSFDGDEGVVDKLKQAVSTGDTTKPGIGHATSLSTSSDQQTTSDIRQSKNDFDNESMENELDEQSKELIQSDVSEEKKQTSWIEGIRQAISAPLVAVTETVQKVVDNFQSTTETDEQLPVAESNEQQVEPIVQHTPLPISQDDKTTNLDATQQAQLTTEESSVPVERRTESYEIKSPLKELDPQISLISLPYLTSDVYYGYRGDHQKPTITPGVQLNELKSSPSDDS